ncbi:MAG: bifunctional (p)ppGpp synthetase/guanosine-3',5'-bis(diphosphate) 3'-pyrophosphohydrolase [Bacteroidales bacterium]|nr:bifunctional (p)ppGpp synthetase/guanosine-3',5'-bis(diphosphate) 3'-pyrophosphohydrolase [Bacteroidales bacterium]MBO5665400.1 bifunctional (p)ppGpp synthetase/guanosine-3',5'-bis(diphosphate) 3'-pyrophosphohydrolase [Bacteroidaceae bacterium]
MDNYEEKRMIDEESAINSAFQELLDIYLASQHRKKVELITKAFNFARQAHKGVRRHSGEPYIMHPLAVARIVCKEIGLGSTSICAALLHDVVEDTDYTVDDIKNLFGDKIAGIVDGLTKISGGVFGAHASEQAENFKKLLLTMSEDIRVILIKIADRLHNMRTLEFMQVNKQYKIAGETLYIYAPIAYRLGLSKIKTELENLSFKYEHPEEYARIEKKIEKTQQQRDILYTEFTHPICEQLDKMGYDYRIIGRVKSPYSIWNKMQKKHVAFEDIFDILAVRIIFNPREGKDENNECFNIYIALTKLYNAHPDRLRDWVNKPRTNGYKALHATFMSQRGEWIEVQIRSEKMNEVAEKGIAAHWKYKSMGEASNEDQLDNWLHTIKEILDDPQPNALDFLDTIKLNLYATEIFVFTPKGEIKTMPQNCTALDLAYSIHTFLGNHCIGAKVNHRLVPMNHQLQSGDQVEILTSNAPRVEESWLSFVTTAKARSKIQAALRRQQRLLQRDGEEKLNAFLEEEGLSNYAGNVEKLWKRHKLKDRDELLAAIGKGTIILGAEDKDELLGNKKFSFQSLFSFNRDKKKEEKEVEKYENIDRKKAINLTDDNLKSSYIIADCCHPIPGDDVLGYYDEDKHIVIHKRSCPHANTLKSSHGDRILAAKWETHKQLYFAVPIQIKGIDDMGVLHEITTIIYQQLNANIQKMHIESNDGIFEGTFWINVHDVEEVKNICENLKKIKNIKTIARIG